MNIPDTYRFTARDVENAHDVLRRYWMNDPVSPPTMDEVEFSELAEVAERMANGGRLPTVGEGNAKLARDVAAHHLRKYEAAKAGGGLYDHTSESIFWEPKRLAPEKRKRLQREQAEALR